MLSSAAHVAPPRTRFQPNHISMRIHNCRGPERGRVTPFVVISVGFQDGKMTCSWQICGMTIMACIVKVGAKVLRRQDECMHRVPHGIWGAKGPFGSDFEF